jgi:hypothetical protein
MKEYNGGKNELVISFFIKIHFLIVKKKKKKIFIRIKKRFLHPLI